MGKIIIAGGNINNVEDWTMPPSLKSVEIIDVLNPNNTCRNLPEFPFPFKSKHFKTHYLILGRTCIFPNHKNLVNKLVNIFTNLYQRFSKMVNNVLFSLMLCYPKTIQILIVLSQVVEGKNTKTCTRVTIFEKHFTCYKFYQMGLEDLMQMGFQ